jgi:hypothetical protein
MNSFIHIDDQPSTADFQFVAQGMNGLPLQASETLIAKKKNIRISDLGERCLLYTICSFL